MATFELTFKVQELRGLGVANADAALLVSISLKLEAARSVTGAKPHSGLDRAGGASDGHPNAAAFPKARPSNRSGAGTEHPALHAGHM